MNLLRKLQPRHVDGADQVLEGVAAQTTSGNECKIWPAMTLDHAANQTRVTFVSEWRDEPTPNDIAELMAFTDFLMNGRPEVMVETPGGIAAATDMATNWLRKGKTPPKERTN